MFSISLGKLEMLTEPCEILRSICVGEIYCDVFWGKDKTVYSEKKPRHGGLFHHILRFVEPRYFICTAV